MQPVIVIVCQYCKRMGHFAMACPDNPDNKATPEEQERAFQIMQEALRPSPFWKVAFVALVTMGLLWALTSVLRP